LIAVAVIVAVLEAPGNSGPKFEEEAETLTNAIVAALELSKVPGRVVSETGVVLPLEIVTQTPPATLVPEQPVGKLTETPVAGAVPVML